MNTSKKWFWKMEYCYNHGLPPAQEWVWNKAEQEWLKECSKNG